MVFTDLVRVEADLDFHFLLWLYNALGLRNLKNSLLLYLSIIQFPCYLVFIDVLNHDAHVFGVTPVRFGNDFSLKINNGRLEHKLGLDRLTKNCWAVVNSDWILDKHRNRNFIVSCLLWIELDIKSICFLRLYNESELSIFVFVFLYNFLFFRVTVLQLLFVNILSN